MSVKLNHYWTINHSKKEAYDKFIIKKFIPKINQLGVHTVAGWSVLVGAYSEIIFENAANDLETLETALRDKRYKAIKADLLNYVRNYKTKVLVASGKKDTYSMDVREDTVKFNQMWDIISEKKEAYDQFVTEKFYPTLEALGISVAGEWEVLIGDSPSIICEGRVTDINQLILNLQGRKFQEAKQELRHYVETYESRILTFHVQKLKGYKSASYKIISG